MIQTKPRVTVDEFYEFIKRPENIERNFELIGGEIVEKMVSHPYASQVTSRVIRLFGNFIDEHQLGHLTSADGGYIVGKQRFIPDMAFVSYKRMPELIAEKGYVKIAPDFVVEVISPTDTPRAVTKKINDYLEAGVIVLAVYPDEQEIDLYIPNQPTQTFSGDDVLKIEPVLPGFAVAAKDGFPPRRIES